MHMTTEKPRTRRLTINISEEFLSDVLTVIVETPGVWGIHQWATIDEWNGTTAKLHYDRADDDEGSRKGRATLTVASVLRGIQAIAETPRETMGLHPSNIGRVLGAAIANDSSDIDGEAGDWIAQAAIFGKQVYS
jgi:hypothetical protein